MLPPRSNPPVEPVLLSHDDIAERELVFAAQRRRRRWFGMFTALTLALCIAFGARPALHVAKAWQARRLAAQARELMDQEQWLAARDKIADAYQIWPNEPEAIRTMGSFLNRVGNFRPSLTFWQQLEKFGALTPGDQREYATSELAVGNVDAAEVRLRQAWPAGTPGTLEDWPLGIQLALRREQPARAAALARLILADPRASDRVRLNAANVLLTTEPGENAQTLARQTYETIASGGKSVESLEALCALCRWAALPTAAALKPPLPPLDELLTRLDAHPRAGVAQHLYALDLRAAAQPARRAEFIQDGLQRYRSTKADADLAVLANWLYANGEYASVLDVLTPARANGDRALFLQRLDALAALDRWKDIRVDIQAAKFPLEPMIAQMYLARCAEQLGEPQVRDACWEAALGDAGKDAAKLMTVGQYAKKNGVPSIAGRALRAAVAAAPDWRDANAALFQMLQASGQTRELRDALAAFAIHAPQDLSLANDLAYCNALLGENVPAARETARELIRADPTSLPHHTLLALAELRLGDAFAALDVFKTLNLPPVSAVQASQRAVYAAVLWQTSYEHEAHEVAKATAHDSLLPEERALIQPILDSPAP